MLRHLTRITLTTAAIAAAMSLPVPAAMAADTWTVTGGLDFTGVQTSGAVFTFTDFTMAQSFRCTRASVMGTVTNQTHSTNTRIGTIPTPPGSTTPALTFGSCTGPLGSTATVAQKSGTAAAINVKSYDNLMAVTTGTITDLDLIGTINLGGIRCTAEIKGTAGFTYTNSTSVLAFITAGDSMTITDTNCPVLGTSDVITLVSSGGLRLTGSPNNPITISQP